jgi:hypothetical protein
VQRVDIFSAAAKPGLVLSVEQGATARGRRAFAGALLALSCSQPAENTRPELNAQQLNRECSSCHLEIAGEWARSEHHRSADDVFRRALSREPLRFCEACHAPEAPTSQAAAGALGALGVACVTCHAVTEHTRAVPVERLPARHPTVGVASGVDACRSCHEFAFPGERAASELFQSTVTEHAASSYAGTSCSGCHMPSVTGRGKAHASHAFAASRSSEAQRAAVRVVAERTGATSLRLSLSSRGVGHAYPTGDLFRRLAIRVEARSLDFAVMARDERLLARHFDDALTAPRISERRVISDDRLLPGETRVVDVELGPAAAGLELAYRVELERVLHMNPRFESFAQVESRELLASGQLPAQPEKSR